MNASEAKKQAIANKKQVEENVKLRREKNTQENVDLLHKHLMNKVEEAVKQGKMSTESIQFDVDRFSDAVVREVADRLESDGFTLSKSQVHNAYQKISFTVAWV